MLTQSDRFPGIQWHHQLLPYPHQPPTPLHSPPLLHPLIGSGQDFDPARIRGLTSSKAHGLAQSGQAHRPGPCSTHRWKCGINACIRSPCGDGWATFVYTWERWDAFNITPDTRMVQQKQVIWAHTVTSGCWNLIPEILWVAVVFFDIFSSGCLRF